MLFKIKTNKHWGLKEFLWNSSKHTVRFLLRFLFPANLTLLNQSSLIPRPERQVVAILRCTWSLFVDLVSVSGQFWWEILQEIYLNWIFSKLFCKRVFNSIKFSISYLVLVTSQTFITSDRRSENRNESFVLLSLSPIRRWRNVNLQWSTCPVLWRVGEKDINFAVLIQICKSQRWGQKTIDRQKDLTFVGLVPHLPTRLERRLRVVGEMDLENGQPVSKLQLFHCHYKKGMLNCKLQI